MKMLCFLAGELSNAAKYFTTFAMLTLIITDVGHTL